MQEALIAPQHPAYASVDQTELMSRSVDGDHTGDLEVPVEPWVSERRDKSARRAVDVNRNVQSCAFLQLIDYERTRSIGDIISNKVF